MECSLTFYGTNADGKKIGLNPYSNGMLSDGIHLSLKSMDETVLILILMECPLTLIVTTLRRFRFLS